MSRRVQVAMPAILTSYFLGLLVIFGHHSFWRSHGDLANLLIGGLVALGVLVIAVNVWAHLGTKGHPGARKDTRQVI